MSELQVVAIAGGVGGAKLASGLQSVLHEMEGTLTVVVNTGDDFVHWGLTVCPDLDTVLYNLADVHNLEFGWGRRGETFTTLDALSQIGGEEWFRIGDLDLAVHLRRSEWLRQGDSLTDITDRLRRSFGVTTTILPMCDEPVRTLVHTDEGDLPFQHYFVRRRCEPVVFDLTYVGATDASVTKAVRQAIKNADLIVFCPSNPYLSIDPILAVPGMRKLIREARGVKVAVSPIVGGRAIKGPAAKMMREMGEMISPLTVVDHLSDLLDGFVLDREDAAVVDAIQVAPLVTDTMMPDNTGRTRLAREVIDFGISLQAHSLRDIEPA